MTVAWPITVVRTSAACCVCGGDASGLHCRYEAGDGRKGRVCSRSCALAFEVSPSEGSGSGAADDQTHIDSEGASTC